MDEWELFFLYIITFGIKVYLKMWEKRILNFEIFLTRDEERKERVIIESTLQYFSKLFSYYKFQVANVTLLAANTAN